jgi:hypothetical protein
MCVQKSEMENIVQGRKKGRVPDVGDIVKSVKTKKGLH